MGRCLNRDVGPDEMNTIWQSTLGWVWIFGTALFAAALLSAAMISTIMAAKQRRVAFLGLAGLFLLLAAISALANPVANLLMFNRIADANTSKMIADMRTRCPVGTEAKDFVSVFGQPTRARIIGGREIWTYDANPWWMIGWTEIEIGVVSNRIEGHWTED